MNAGIGRMLQVTMSMFLLVHLMACFWYLSAKLNNFDDDTWVAQEGMQDAAKSTLYLFSCNWSLQTLTTVGYGDVSIGPGYEKLMTIMWMFFGVGFYSFTIGNLASIISSID